MISRIVLYQLSHNSFTRVRGELLVSGYKKFCKLITVKMKPYGVPNFISHGVVAGIKFSVPDFTKILNNNF